MPTRSIASEPRRILAALVGICTFGTLSAEQTSRQDRSIVSNATNKLGYNLIATGATLDGAPITALRQTRHCEAIMTTTRESTLVHWKDLGNLIARKKGARTTFDVPAGGRHHVLSVRNGKAETDVTVGLGVLDEECGGV